MNNPSLGEPTPHPANGWARARRGAFGQEPLEGAYGAPFWYSYGANAALMTAVSLLFRYADFVKVVGGAEFAGTWEYHLGWIAGVGMVGSLAMRLVQGVGIDRHGPRQVWMISLAVVFVSCLGQLQVTRIDTAPIYLWQILFQTGIAGAFGASITHISHRAPLPRMTEIVGTLGTSGFVGIMLGTFLGDLICGAGEVERWRLERLFIAAAALTACSLALVWLATRGQTRPVRKRRRPPSLWLVRKYHPGMLLLVGVAMGFGLGMSGVFVRPFAAALGIAGIAQFFWVYTCTAFAARLAIRRFPARYGVRPMVLVGLVSLATGMLSFLLVGGAWQLPAPAVFLGVAHAILFPSVVAGGSALFPSRHRGLGTTLMLAMFDVGNLVGRPLAGAVLYGAGKFGLPAYPAMFVTVAVLLGLTTAVYAVSREARRRHARDVQTMHDARESAANEASNYTFSASER